MGQFNCAAQWFTIAQLPELTRRFKSTRMNTTQRLPLHLLSVALLPATVLFLARPIAAEILWRGDFETGTTEQWRGTATKSDSVKVVTDPVRAGKYALQIDGTNAARRGDRDRIEL